MFKDKSRMLALLQSFLFFAGIGAGLGALFYKKDRKKGALVGAGIGTIALIGTFFMFRNYTVG